jgi:YidC/Oxa1 family membrane protein insertase
MMEWFDTILWPLKVAVAWIMVQVHSGLSFVGLDPDSGLSWALSIVGLVIVMRIILIPLFVKQIRAARGMQMLSPDLQALQKKYKGKQDPASREAMSREMMELYRKHGTNPFASCLPILAQSPIFFALFRVLYNMPKLAQEPGTPGAYPRESIGPLTRELAHDFTDATLFGARLSDWFFMSDPPPTMSTRIVTVVLIILMSATTFFTQKQLTQKNMPASAMQGPMAQQQKMLLYLLPVVFAVSGVNFPIGVLIYWTTTNLWSMGQQFYVIRRSPTPGSEAERRLKERRRRKAEAKGIVFEEEAPEPEKPRGQRQQPVRKGRARPRLDANGKPIPPAARKPGQVSPKGDGASDAAPEDGRRSDGRTRKPGASSGGGTAPDAAGRQGGRSTPSANEARRRRSRERRAADGKREETAPEGREDESGAQA